MHVPPAHAATALGKEHTVPQVPQLDVSVPLCTSQPSEARPLQSEYPTLQAYPQRPLAHDGEALGTAGHTVPQVPQLEGSVARLVHDPEQLVSEPAQVTTQTPREHTCPDTHAVPHAPQLFTSELVSLQTPEQLDCPAGHTRAQ